MFGIKEIIIASAFSLSSIFVTRLYYINKIQKIQLKEHKKSQIIQENVLNINDATKDQYKKITHQIERAEIKLLNKEQYFNEANNLYDQYLK